MDSDPVNKQLGVCAVFLIEHCGVFLQPSMLALGEVMDLREICTSCC